tara:strand:+ start:179 stop:514 length:336 start_codon:yes stop_codon:yes gene_type:complete
MFELPNSNLCDDERMEFYTNIFVDDLVKHVSIYILSNDLITSFYNISDFFLKHRIDNDEVKNNLKTIIIGLLQDKNYKLAYVFNKTGLVICRNEEEMEKTVWKSNLDFVKL